MFNTFSSHVHKHIYTLCSQSFKAQWVPLEPESRITKAIPLREWIMSTK